MRSTRGFSLLEVVIAMAVLSTGVLAMSGLTLSARQAGFAAAQLGVAQLAARVKIEELRMLAWTSDAGVVPVSDWSTDLTVTPPRASGGVGLGSSPGDTLRTNVSGYCDFLDDNGQWVSSGTRPPAAAAWVRRWMVQPSGADPDLLVIQVLVVPVRQSSVAAAISTGRALNGAWLTAYRARRAR
jgi:prepilin-type N-terminal cleavage/methylation domain-containing protein